MKKTMAEIDLGATYLLKTVGTLWRVQHLLNDNIHVRLANVADPYELKTVSVAALRDGPFQFSQPAGC